MNGKIIEKRKEISSQTLARISNMTLLSLRERLGVATTAIWPIATWCSPMLQSVNDVEFSVVVVKPEEHG